MSQIGGTARRRLLAFPRDNNLQWLRLVFALQVVIMHGASHLGGVLVPRLDHAPGVPAFFFVSGFLIYASYQNAPGRRYFQNRFLRLMPALVFVTVGSLAIVLYARGPGDLLAHPSTYASWFVAQVTLGQAYNPGLFRDVGVGVINGALWTLTTEILFYLCVPVIVWVEGRFRHIVWYLVAASFLVYAVGPMWWVTPIYRDKSVYDILALTPIVWGWMFGIGILAVRHFHRIQRWLPWFPLAVLPLGALIALGDHGPLLGASGNLLGLLYFIPYIAVVMYLAFGIRVVRLETDLSYGVYIWHMPVINFLLVWGGTRSLWVAIGLTVAMAALSWFVVEKPTLRLKRTTLKRVAA